MTLSEIRPPALGDFVRLLRTRHTDRHPCGLARQELAQALHISIGYLVKIESNAARSPAVSILDQFVDALDLSVDERRHLFDLARRAPTARELVGTHSLAGYRGAIEPAQRLAMDSVVPHLMAYLDERWNIVACNTEYDRVFPGLKDAGNVLTWFFSSDYSQQVMVDWEAEARLTVGWFRALMGRYYADDWAASLLATLEDYPTFCDFWTETPVRFGRPSPFMRVRDPRSGAVSIVHVQVDSLLVGDYAMQVYLGVRIPTEAYGQMTRETPQ